MLSNDPKRCGGKIIRIINKKKSISYETKLNCQSGFFCISLSIGSLLCLLRAGPPVSLLAAVWEMHWLFNGFAKTFDYIHLLHQVTASLNIRSDYDKPGKKGTALQKFLMSKRRKKSKAK